MTNLFLSEGGVVSTSDLLIEHEASRTCVLMFRWGMFHPRNSQDSCGIWNIGQDDAHDVHNSTRTPRQTQMSIVSRNPPNEFETKTTYLLFLTREVVSCIKQWSQTKQVHTNRWWLEGPYNYFFSLYYHDIYFHSFRVIIMLYFIFFVSCCCWSIGSEP